MAARSRTQALHGAACDAEDTGSGGVHVEEREAVAELMKNYCEAMMLRWNPLKNAYLLCVGSAFSPASALPDRLS